MGELSDLMAVWRRHAEASSVPGSVPQASYEAFLALISRPDCPRQVFEWAVGSRHSFVREPALLSAHCPEDLKVLAALLA